MNPKYLKWFHLGMMCVWVLLVVPALLWWKDSIIFVILLSLYANFAANFAAYQGARTEVKEEDG